MAREAHLPGWKSCVVTLKQIRKKKTNQKNPHNLIAELKAETWFHRVARLNCIELSHPKAKQGWAVRAFRWQRQQCCGAVTQQVALFKLRPGGATHQHQGAHTAEQPGTPAETSKGHWTAPVKTHGECNGFVSTVYKVTLVYNLWSS